MKTIITSLLFTAILCCSINSQTGTIKIYSDDTTTLGIASMNSYKVSGINTKQIYIQRGVSFPIYGNPNQSGKYLKLNRSNLSWYYPANGFLNAAWCFCTCSFTCNPPHYICNNLLNFAVSVQDTQLIIKNLFGDCGCDAGDATYMTYNNGTTTNPLSQFSNGFSGIQNYGFDIDPQNDNIIYVGYSIIGTSFRCIFKSTNRGANWIATDTNSNFSQGLLKIYPLKTSRIFVCGYSDMMMSTNSGADFFDLNVPPLSYLVFDPVDSSVYGLKQNFGIYKSSNGGFNWVQVAAGNYKSLEISAVNHSILYAGSPAGLHKSVDGGAAWSLYNDSFSPSKVIIGLAMDQAGGDTVFAATPDAVYKVWGGWTGITDLGGPVPESFSLGQNYPNPFNPVTKFNFRILRTSNVRLVIYDILGKEIQILLSQQIQPGNYEVQWDAAAYPSGVYYYRIESSEYTSSRKMVLTK